VRTPDEIQKDRLELEAKLEKLDDEEQAWSDLSRAEQVAERLHKDECKKTHGSYNAYADSCRWNNEPWGNPSYGKKPYLQRAQKLLELLPEDYESDKVLEIVKASRPK
jgi:hypothetical protein